MSLGVCVQFSVEGGSVLIPLTSVKVPMESLNNAIASGCSAYDVELLFVSSDMGNGDLLNEMCRNGLTPLCLACKLNRADLVPLLLHRGAKPNVSSIYLRKYPLHYACDHSDGNLDIVNMLLAFNAEVYTLCVWACRCTHVFVFVCVCVCVCVCVHAYIVSLLLLCNVNVCSSCVYVSVCVHLCLCIGSCTYF